MSAKSCLGALAASAFFALACGGPPAIEIPPPAGLDGLDAAVQAQYRQRRVRLDEVLADRRAGPAERAEAVGRLGMWYQVYRYLEGAELCYRAAIAEDPGAHRWSYYLAHVRRDAGALEDARARFRRLAEVEATRIPALVWLAEIERSEHRLDAASALYRSALGGDPGCVMAEVGLGLIALERRDFEAARQRLERAFAAQPEATPVLYGLSRAYLGLGEERRAETLLARLPEKRPDEVPARINDPLMDELVRLRAGMVDHLQAGIQAQRQGRLPQAIARYRRAIAADEKNLNARVHLSLALQRAGRARAARREIEAAVERFPDSATARLHLAELLAEEGRLTAAEEQLRTALAGDPQGDDLHYLLAQVLQASGRCREALEHFATARDLDPRLARAGHGHAACLIVLGRYGEAARALEAHLRALPGAPELQALLVRVLAAAPEDAARDPRRALELAGRLEATTVHGAESAAMAHAAAGRFAAAAAWQSAAVAALGATAPARCDAPLARRRLDAYRARRPLRRPWAPGEKICELPIDPPVSSARR